MKYVNTRAGVLSRGVFFVRPPPADARTLPVPPLPFCFLLLISCFLLIASCSDKKEDVKIVQEVTTATVERGTIERTVPFTGSIVAKNAVDLFPHATGKVSEKLLQEGDLVKRGQPILLAERDEVGYSFKPMPITSPIDGIVSRINVDIGTNVTPNTAVATVVQPGDVRVKLDMPEQYLDAITIGDEVAMETFKGKIITKSPALDEKTRTARVEIEIPNPDGSLRHGALARINLVVERHEDVLKAPYGAISWEGQKQFVYEIKDGKAVRRQVTVGLRNETHVEVLEGIEEGIMLATSNLLNLKDGEAVIRATPHIRGPLGKGRNNVGATLCGRPIWENNVGATLCGRPIWEGTEALPYRAVAVTRHGPVLGRSTFGG